MPDAPEVLLARRLIKVHKLTPPIDVDVLIRKYASLEYADIPGGVDGLCHDLKVSGKTRVFINRQKPKTRQRFTAAHELGHIIIPWHFGSIVDQDIFDNDNLAEEIHYRVQEGEANRFASELLMPLDWVLHLIEEERGPSFAMAELLRSGVSPQAASIRMRECLPQGYISGAYRNGVLEWAEKSRTTIADPPRPGTVLPPESAVPFAEQYFKLEYTGITYVWWKLGGVQAVPQDMGTSWREALTIILDEVLPEEVDREKFWRSLSGQLAQANSRVVNVRNIDTLYDALYQKLISRQDRPIIGDICRHPLFEQFLVQRASAFLEAK